MFEIGDWIHAPYCNISGMVFFVDEQYITVTIKCDLQDQHARCPYNITCVCVPRDRWGVCCLPRKKDQFTYTIAQGLCWYLRRANCYI